PAPCSSPPLGPPCPRDAEGVATFPAGPGLPRLAVATPRSTGAVVGERGAAGVLFCLVGVKENDAEGLWPASAFTLDWLWLCSTGCFWWDHWLCKSSVPSLAAGLLFGSLAGLGAYQLSQDPRNIWVFLATSGTLAGIMGMRFYHSGKFLPAGLIAGASLLMVAKLGISVLNRPHQ
uniref:Transmembrane protein 14C n=1 Tax=Felis catus TaxID=9685 RepID=A0ABI7YH88_FELCA